MPAFAKCAAMPPPMVPEPMTTALAMLKLDNRSSSVDHDGVAGDVARRVRGEEERDALQLTGIADAPDRIAALDLRLDVLDHRIGEPRVKEARRDGVHADAARAPGRGQLTGQADQRGLAGD